MPTITQTIPPSPPSLPPSLPSSPFTSIKSLAMNKAPPLLVLAFPPFLPPTPTPPSLRSSSSSAGEP